MFSKAKGRKQFIGKNLVKNMDDLEVEDIKDEEEEDDLDTDDKGVAGDDEEEEEMPDDE